MTLATHFLPAERLAPAQIEVQTAHFLLIAPLLRPFLDAVPDLLMALNTDRQIVFANQALLTYVGRHETALHGLRPGEALDCAHSHDELGGCGTSVFCSTCGAARAILASQRGETTVQECRLTRQATGEALDLRVWATPMVFDGQALTLVALHDISHEKRRRALERIFFHDVLNTVSALRAATEMLARREDEPVSELLGITQGLVGRLADEVVAQRQLTDAEGDDLVVNLQELDAAKLLQTLVATYARQAAGAGHHIHTQLPAGPVHLVSDAALLRRVLGNLLKNAIEASGADETVTLGCAAGAPAEGGGVVFWVHNPVVMPADVQLQVFQRSFSTKGIGRGLGTYGARLLSERYLGGRVWFTSAPDAGTTFWARYGAPQTQA